MLCAKFDYPLKGRPPCQECWHGYCFSANPDRDPYYYGFIEDVEGIPCNYNTKDGLMHRQLTNGAHLFMPFLDPTCHFCNIQYIISTSSAKYRVFMMYITS